MKRVVACDKEAMAGVSGFVSTRVFSYTQDAFPYMVNRIGTKALNESPDDTFDYTRTIAKRLVIAHSTEGFKEQVADRVTDWITKFEDYYRENDMLTSAFYSTVPTYLAPAGVILSADTGVVYFANSGLGLPLQVGVEFTLQVPIMRSNY
jgi:hypothetical protein